MSTATALVFQNDAKQLVAKRLQERKKGLLVLILRHLADFGYKEAYKRLEAEAGVSLDQVDAAQNLSLLSILQDYEEQYEFKYGRKPQLLQKCNSLPKEGGMQQSQPGQYMSGAAMARDRRNRGANRRSTDTAIGRQHSSNSIRAAVDNDAAGTAAAQAPVESLGVTGLAIQTSGYTSAADGRQVDGEDGADQPLMKPLPDLGTSELRELGAAITQDIYTSNQGVSWGDVAGLEGAKHLLREALVMPLQFPDIFTGILTPWKGILFYGPPGTGKTLLARAVATECKTTFFNISASSVASKWRGNSEKLVKVLFELARYHAPSTIFLDEIDALMTVRGAEGEHEASRRTKTEFLIQMDGLAQSNAQVFVLAATNLPWQLDLALLRRLEKRIYVGLPDAAARILMFTSLLKDRGLSIEKLGHLSSQTAGYSGSDIASLCKEVAMRPVRRFIADMQLLDSHCAQTTQVPGSITAQDVKDALLASKPSASLNESKYQEFGKQHGHAVTLS
ncbi:hypothetical protein WJX77_012098 [Trebouxia sp. C0004]